MSERPYKNFQIGVFDNPAPKTDPPIRSGKVKPKKSLDAYTDLELVERVEELEAKLEKAEADSKRLDKLDRLVGRFGLIHFSYRYGLVRDVIDGWSEEPTFKLEQEQ